MFQRYNNSSWFKLLVSIPLVLMFVFVLSLKTYNQIGKISSQVGDPVCLKTFVDDLIPFNIYFVIPYVFVLVFPYSIGIVFSFYRKIIATDIVSVYLALVIMTLSCYSIYLLFPTTAECVMITSFENSGLSEEVFNRIQKIYARSIPYNAFPSLHVAPVVFLIFYFYKRWRKLFWISLPMMVAGALGTVFLKFHVFVDLLGGAAIGVLMYYVFDIKIAPAIARVLKGSAPDQM